MTKRQDRLAAAVPILTAVLFLSACRSPVSPSATVAPATLALVTATPAVAAAASQQPKLAATPQSTPIDAPSPATVTPAAPRATAAVPVTCDLTPEDMLGPFYVPGAPVRDSVGEGYELSGTVRSGAGCAPLPGAQIEFWMAGPDGEYSDDFRATMLADAGGGYVFRSHRPPPYSGRPPHIHLRVSADGHRTLVSQYYPEGAAAAARFDIVLAPEP